MNDKIKKQLITGLQQLNLTLSVDNQSRLMQLLQLLAKWNNRFNLTSISKLEDMVSYHLLDSLSIVPFIVGERVMDFGSGAGFPGIPLSCYFPKKHFVLVESVGKKARFIIQACAELQLNNVEVVASRVELLSKDKYQFDCIISRAVCELQEFIALTKNLSHANTTWVAMKGIDIEDELKQLKLPYQVMSLKVPGVRSSRQAIIINPAEKKKG